MSSVVQRPTERRSQWFQQQRLPRDRAILLACVTNSKLLPLTPFFLFNFEKEIRALLFAFFHQNKFDAVYPFSCLPAFFTPTPLHLAERHRTSTARSMFPIRLPESLHLAYTISVVMSTLSFFFFGSLMMKSVTMNKLIFECLTSYCEIHSCIPFVCHFCSLTTCSFITQHRIQDYLCPFFFSHNQPVYIRR